MVALGSAATAVHEATRERTTALQRPWLKNATVNCVLSKSPDSGAHSKIAGYDSSNLAQISPGNIGLDAPSRSGNQDAMVFLGS
jgi:hypothetical protein